MKDTESRRQFMKKGIAAGAGIVGLSKIDTAKALSMGKLKALANVQGNIEIEKAKKIYTSEGEALQYNSFGNMDFWHGKYYVVFRQAVIHGPSTCRLILLESTDLENWTETIVLDRPSIDDRDAKLLSTPERLILYTVPYPTTTELMYTEDGVNWSAPVEAAPALPGAQFWKPKRYNGVYYSGADSSSTYLLKSPNGINSWEVVSTITSQNAPTETAIVFLEDGRCIAFIRQNTSGTLPGFAISSPPYTSWSYELNTTGPVQFSGQGVERFGDLIVVVSRAMLGTTPGKWDYPLDPSFVPADMGQRTVVYTFDLATMSLSLKAILPTERGGDSSYVGILPTDRNRFLVSWHDGQVLHNSGNPSDIWLAHIKIV